MTEQQRQELDDALKNYTMTYAEFLSKEEDVSATYLQDIDKTILSDSLDAKVAWARYLAVKPLLQHKELSKKTPDDRYYIEGYSWQYLVYSESVEEFKHLSRRLLEAEPVLRGRYDEACRQEEIRKKEQEEEARRMQEEAKKQAEEQRMISLVKPTLDCLVNGSAKDIIKNYSDRFVIDKNDEKKFKKNLSAFCPITSYHIISIYHKDGPSSNIFVDCILYCQQKKGSDKEWRITLNVSPSGRIYTESLVISSAVSLSE